MGKLRLSAFIVAAALLCAAATPATAVTTGKLDTTFSSDGLVSFSQWDPTQLATTTTGYLYVASRYGTNAVAPALIQRFRPSGTLDPRFSNDGLASISLGNPVTTIPIAIEP